MRTWITALTLSALLAACGGSGSQKHKAAPTRAATLASAKPVALRAASRPAPPPPDQAFVTAETENRLLVVELPSGRVVRRIALARDPEDVSANGGECSTVMVVSAAGRAVTVLDRETLNPRRVLGGFVAPHIPEIAPGGQYGYVTDDGAGTVTAIYLGDARVTSTIEVGAGAHHLSFDTAQRRAWVALGESARTIVVLSTQRIGHPRVIGRFDPGFAVHDLSFSPDDTRVWVTAAAGTNVAVLDAESRRLLFRVPAGPPPQHVALTDRYAYLTSGYGSTIEQVDVESGRILHRARTPDGSFELAADSRYVVVSSLLRGTLAIFTPQLKLLRVVHLAPATREVALSSPAGSQP
ncbi:MAG: YncE family protein [Solirubrobacteraceae bacterium]